MKKSNILIAIFAVVAAASCAMAGGGTMDNLAETSKKIATMDINKNAGEANPPGPAR
ncbi:MAG: hypothetical protein WCK76_09580 [Elusimicrobiota bacterium]